MKINTTIDKGKWVKWEDGVEFLLRPFPISQIPKGLDDVEFGIKMFKYCIVDCRGLIDEETGKPIRFNDKMKQYLFDYYPGMANFIAVTVSKIMVDDEKESKN